jgi:hypothetical protein
LTLALFEDTEAGDSDPLTDDYRAGDGVEHGLESMACGLLVPPEPCRELID